MGDTMTRGAFYEDLALTCARDIAGQDCGDPATRGLWLRTGSGYELQGMYCEACIDTVLAEANAVHKANPDGSE